MMVHRYEGRARWQDFLKDVYEVEGGTVSPGGAARMLGVRRSFISELMDRNQLDAWEFREPWTPRAVYQEISVLSVLAYARRVGREIQDNLGLTLNSVQ